MVDTGVWFGWVGTFCCNMIPLSFFCFNFDFDFYSLLRLLFGLSTSSPPFYSTVSFLSFLADSSARLGSAKLGLAVCVRELGVCVGWEVAAGG